MKATTMAAILLSLLTLSPGFVDSHSGGTDARGCHNNRKTGDYHCHRPKTIRRGGGCAGPVVSERLSYDHEAGREFLDLSPNRRD
jgi:hypothetical protein